MLAIFAAVWQPLLAEILTAFDGFDGAFADADWGVPIVSAVLVGACVAMLLTPVYAAWRSVRTYYVVTERRAVIFGRTWRTEIRSFDGMALLRCKVLTRGGRAGSIVFKRTYYPSDATFGASDRAWGDEGFLGLADYLPAQQALRHLIAEV